MIPLVPLVVNKNFEKEGNIMSKEVQIAVRVEKEMYDKIAEIAVNEGSSVHGVFQARVREWVPLPSLVQSDYYSYKLPLL